MAAETEEQSIQNRAEFKLNTKHPNYEDLINERTPWRLICRAGILDDEFLSIQESETKEDYSDRKKSTAFPNLSRRILDIYTSHLFADSPSYIGEGEEGTAKFPEQLAVFKDDCDGLGTNMNRKIRTYWEQYAQPMGHCHFLITMTGGTAEDQSEVPLNRRISLKEQEELGIRIVVEGFSFEALYDYGLDKNGRLDYIVFAETITRTKGPGEGHDKFEVRRIWTKQEWARYESKVDDDDKNTKEEDMEFEFITGGRHELGEVPLVTLYNSRIEMFDSDSEMRVLAPLNLELYALKSFINIAVKYAGFPWAIVSGNPPRDDKGNIKKFEVGSNRLQFIGNAADFKFAETTGAAMKEGREWYDKCVREMIDAGLRNTDTDKPSGTRESGLSRLIKAANIRATVDDKANNLQESERRIWYFIALWLENGDSDKAKELTKEIVTWAPEVNPDVVQTQMKDLVDMYIRGALDINSLLTELKADGFLSDSFDIKAAISRIRAMGMENMGDINEEENTEAETEEE